MSAATSVAAAGAFASLLPLGLVSARVLVDLRPRDVVALALPLAIALWSIPLAVAAALGHFHAAWNGVLGWVVTFAAIAILAAPRQRAFRGELQRAVVDAWPALATLAVAACIYALAASETVIGGRDEGLYTLAGLALERSGTTRIAAPDAIARASGLFAPFVSGIPFFLPGIPAAGELRPQFSPLLSAWIAQLHAVGGDFALYRINLLFAVAGGVVFHALARRVLRRGMALLALVLFALNPAEVWIARINLAEPLGALLALGGLLLAVAYVRAGKARRLWAAIALLALAAFVRIDAIIVAPLLAATAIASRLWLHDEGRSAALARLAAGAAAGQSLAVALLAQTSFAYVVEHARFLLLAPAATGLGLMLYAIVPSRVVAPLARAEGRRVVAIAVCTVLALLFAYAWWLRPHLEPFAVIADRGSVLAGMRDYREESLRNAAAYLGWPCLLLALAGMMLKSWRTLHGRGSPATLAIFVLALGISFVYLAAPRVSPDHPWAVRRMVTLVFPLLILAAGYGLQSALQVAVRRRSACLAYVAAPMLAAWLLLMQRATLDFSENAGLTAQLRAIDAALPRGPLVMRNLEGLATTFALGFGREVLPLRDESVAVDAASRRFWSACAARGCTLVHTNFEGLNGLAIRASAPMQAAREYIQPTLRPPAHARTRETLSFVVSHVAGIASDAPPSNAGAARDWRLDDRGFYRDELVPGLVARWTNGDASLALPATRGDRLELRLASAIPRPQPVTIDIDGAPLFDGELMPGETRMQFPLDNSPSRTHRIALKSSTFVPGNSAGGQDRRSLGVAVRAVRMLAGAAAPLATQSPADDFRSHLVVRATRSDARDRPRSFAFRADVENSGTAVWTANAEADRTTPWVALGIYWTRPGDVQRLVEQRVELPYSLRPGEQWTTAIVADLDDEPLRTLQPGHYELHVGLVLEGVAWFAERGDRSATIPITIAAP